MLDVAVCIKRVVDMETRFRIAADGASIDETGAKYDVNDFDMYAIEAALQLRDKAGAGEVVVLSLGPVAAQEQIRKALSMAIDRQKVSKLGEYGYAPPTDAIARAAASTRSTGRGHSWRQAMSRASSSSATDIQPPATSDPELRIWPPTGFPCRSNRSRRGRSPTPGSMPSSCTVSSMVRVLPSPNSQR